MSKPRIGIVLAVVALSGCSLFRSVMALQEVEFSLASVSNVRLAGVRMDDVRSFDDLGRLDAGRITVSAAAGDLPLDLTLHVVGVNPEDNEVEARMLRMEWTLLLQGKETVSGVVTQEYVFPPGQPTEMTIPASLDLLDFFEGSAGDAVDLALSFAGAGGAPKEVQVRVLPTIETPRGPMTFPRPVTVVTQEVGG